MSQLVNKSNNIGIIASSVCLVHCVATPFVFMAKLCTASCCSSTPTWWRLLDYLFLAVAFFAVYQSSKLTSKKWIGVGLWASWVVLFLIMINEGLHLVSVSGNIIYIPTLSLILLHLYNRRFCRCHKGECHVEKIETT